MVELVFNDLKFTMWCQEKGLKQLKQRQTASIEIMNIIVDIISKSTKKLMKLKMSNIYLRNDKLIRNLGSVVENNKNLISLDLSNT